MLRAWFVLNTCFSPSYGAIENFEFLYELLLGAQYVRLYVELAAQDANGPLQVISCSEDKKVISMARQ